MKRWRIYTIGETTVYVHPAMPVYALYALLTGNGLFMAVSTISILLHEAAHALVAKLFSYPPSNIELTPLGAIMHLDDTRRLSSFKRVVMLLAGPCMTFVLCCLAILFSKCGMLSLALGRTIFLCNVSILIVNLLPALPLDGGSLLSLVLEQFLPLRLVQKCMCIIGCILGSGMILLNIYASWRIGGWNLSLAISGCCLMYTAIMATESQVIAALRLFMDRKIAFERKGMQKISWIAVPYTASLGYLVRSLPAGRMALFAGFELGSMRSFGWLTENEVIQHYLESPHSKYSDVVKMYPNRLNLHQNSTI